MPSVDSVLALLALSVFSTALAFTIYFRLIHTLGSVGTTSQAYLRVPIGVAIGTGSYLSGTVAATLTLISLAVLRGLEDRLPVQAFIHLEEATRLSSCRYADLCTTFGHLERVGCL